MPPRYAYWTIIAGGLPTAFRAAEREELLPTFQRIREKHPDAQMKWFARGKLWESPEAARARPDDARGRRPSGDKRGRDWRPGGEHRDPRQKFVDAKKQKNAALRKDRWDRKNTAGGRGQGAGPGDTPQRPWQDRPQGPRGPQPKRDWRDRPPADRAARPDRPWQDRPRDPSRRNDAKPDWSRRSDAKADTRGPQGKSGWRPKPGGWTPKPGFRGRGTDEPRNEAPKPSPPPRPGEPVIRPPGPSPRGHIKSRRPFRPHHTPPKGPRR
jgi:hypothetical protein